MSATQPSDARTPEDTAMTGAGVVTLREITAATVRAICALEVAESQRRFVAANAISIAQAHFDSCAWFRAIYAGEQPVGFAMLEIDVAKHEYGLWRFMIDHRHQGLGYGRQALELLIEHVRTLPEARTMRLSYSQGPGEPAPFYRKLGFEETGEIEDGERVMRKVL